MAQLTCIVVTPERTALEQSADFVALTLYDGEIGIAPGHAPMIGRVGYGEMRLRHDGQTDHYYLDGGFVQVVNNTVTVLTDRAIPVAKLDAATAQSQLEDAQKMPANSAELLEVRDRKIEQSRAQLQVLRRAK